MKNSTARKLKQVPRGYLVMGVDPHKKRHAAVAVTQDFTTHSKFKFNNSMGGFEMALGRARAEMVRTGSRGVIFAIETGGHYWRNLAYFLDERGIPFHFIFHRIIEDIPAPVPAKESARHYEVKPHHTF